MDLSDIADKEQFYTIVINELKTFGVKYQKSKKKKNILHKPFRKNIFRTQLHLLDLTDVILANGRVVQIPKFVAEACNRILEQVETEGIFRKAGSFVRQKEIRISIESGMSLGKSHHVIDVANVIKYFFRELPEPLIPTSIQETLLRSLLVGENCVKSILLACLLLPPLTINTLSFFMQFLYTVSLSEHLNKMSVQNLAIIFTPGLMPFPDINSHRFTNHVKIVRILIENANAIGVIPNSIQNKLQEHMKTNSSDQSIDGTTNIIDENGLKAPSAKKKKKRRSEMFNGLKKIVGTAMGSSEYLDFTPYENKNDALMHKSAEKIKQKNINCLMETPCPKENKKRKLEHTFNTKKKSDIQAVLPNNIGGNVSNTPTPKESKKSRLSLGGGRHLKNISLNPVVTSMERRWSIVGSGWSKTKNKNASDNKSYAGSNCLFDVESAKEKKDNENESQFSENICSNDDIKEIVVDIKNHLSNELDIIHSSLVQNSPLSTDINEEKEHVQAKYEPIELETVTSSPDTEHLAQRLRQDLFIKQSADEQIIRSPSTRKIGTIRQRSQDKKRLSRNSSWHIIASNNVQCNENTSSLAVKNKPNYKDSTNFYIRNNTHFLLNNSNEFPSHSTSTMCNVKNSMDEYSSERWMSGEEFFSGNQSHVEHVTTPVSRKKDFDENKTPMLPPKSLPRKCSIVRTPLNTIMKPSTTSKVPFVNRIAMSTPVIEEVSGRASIARLRAQNAGMVLAKAKLFDGLGNKNDNGQQNLKTELNSIQLHHKMNDVHSNSDSALTINQNDTTSLENKCKTTLKSTPTAKRIHISNKNSPASSSKRKQRCNAYKYSHKQFMKSIASDDKLRQRRTFNERALTFNNPVNASPKIETLKSSIHCRNLKSPRRVKRNRQKIIPSEFQCHNK